MNNITLITQGLTLDQLLASVRDIVRDEMKSLPQPEKVKPFLSLSEAVELTGLSKSTLYRMTSEKAIPHLKRGGKLLFNRIELIAWINKQNSQCTLRK